MKSVVKPILYVMEKKHGVSIEGLTPEEIDVILKDGRAASPWAEISATKIQFGHPLSFFKKDRKGSDGTMGTEVKNKTEVKTLTGRCVRFQDSQYIGKGRKCTYKNLCDSIEGKKYYIVCDITTPIWKYIFFPSAWLLSHVEKGNLTKSGWTLKNFWATIKKDYQVEYHPVKMKR